MDKKSAPLQATQKVGPLYELYKRFYLEWLDLSDKICLCAKDRGYDLDQNKAALGLIKDTSSNALRIFSDLNEEIEQAFNTIMNPS